jgi:hypothetical protein
MTSPGPNPGTTQQIELSAEISLLNVGNQLMVNLQGHWQPPGPINAPATIQQLNTIIALSNSIEQIAVALLASMGGPGGGPGP